MLACPPHERISGEHRKQHAFSLTEIALALAIISFAGLSMIGLYAVGLKSGSESAETTAAANLAALLIGQRRAAPTDSATNASGLANFALPPLDQSSSNFDPDSHLITVPVYVGKDGFKIADANEASYGLKYNVVKREGLADLYLMLYWPAQAPPENSAGQYEVVTHIALP